MGLIPRINHPRRADAPASATMPAPRQRAAEEEAPTDALAGRTTEAAPTESDSTPPTEPLAQLRTAQVPRELATRVRNRLLAELDPNMHQANTPEVLQRVRELFNTVMDGEDASLTRIDLERLFEEACADILGFGPIEPLLQDSTINEVMVNGHREVYIERGGMLYLTDIQFDDESHVRRIIDRIVSPLGRHVDESTPICDGRLPDGSRVNVTMPPVSLVGSTITIRKFPKTPLTIDDLIGLGTLTAEAAEFLRACVVGRLNVVVSGGAGSGKTTLLNVLSSFIPDGQRIITIEDAAELRLRQHHVIRLEVRPPDPEGEGAITIRDLVIDALRMRPDRIIVGECRSGEALDMLQAMNTGHDGSLTTGHANTPRDMLARLETMVLMGGLDLPTRAIRQQISAAIDLIVQVARMRDGSRKIVQITEVQGMESDTIVLQDIFVFQQEGFEGGKVIGQLKPTRMRPRFMTKLEAAGAHLPPGIFNLPRAAR
jgi:pilus assembly protein CpaF